LGGRLGKEWGALFTKISCNALKYIAFEGERTLGQCLLVEKVRDFISSPMDSPLFNDNSTLGKYTSF